MANLNKILLIGKVGADATLVISKTETKICKFSICTSKKIGDSYVPTWHDIVTFGKTADFAVNIKKGEELFIDGELNKKQYTDKDGNKKISFNIVANIIQRISKSGSTEISSSVDKEEEYDDDLPF